MNYLCTVLCFFFVVALSAQTHTVTPQADVHVDGGTTRNFINLKAKNYNQSVVFLRFDLSSLSGNVQEAQLKLTLKSNNGSGPVNVYLCTVSDPGWTDQVNFTTASLPTEMC